MKKLKTDITGRFPFVLDDYRWGVDGVIAAFTAIAQGFGTRVILFGIENDGSGNFSQGAVLIDSEIYMYAGGHVDIWEVVYLEKILTYDAAGLKEFPDRPEGDKIKDTYIHNYVQVIGSNDTIEPQPANYYTISSFVRLSSILTDIASLKSRVTALENA